MEQDKVISLENLQSCCLQLKSSKAGERRKGAERLTELVCDNEDVCESLDYNSVYKSNRDNHDKVTWNTVFLEAKNYFARETEKMTNNQIGSASKNFCFNMVNRVFEKGTSKHPWINWKYVYDFIYVHLNQSVHRDCYGIPLLNMLHGFLLNESYVSSIEPSAWIELIRLLLKILGKKNVHDFLILKCLNVCIESGSNHPQVISTLRTEVVQFYEKFCFPETEFPKSQISLIIHGLSVLCRKNAVEFRGILCKLGENIIPKIAYSSNYTPDEQEVLINFFCVQIQIHSPCVVDQKHSAFFAHSITKWDEALKAIYNFCVDLLETIAMKMQSHFNEDVRMPNKLLFLAALSTKLVCGHSETSASSEDDEEQLSKRRMRYRTFENILNEVANKTPNKAQLVWIQHISTVLNKFPDLIEDSFNLESLFQIGINFLKSEFFDRVEVYDLLTSLLTSESYYINGHFLNKSRSHRWSTIWECTVRSLSVNKNKDSAMNLLCKLLKVVQPSNLNALLNIFLSNNVGVSSTSLQLLAEFLCRCSLPKHYNVSYSVRSNDQLSNSRVVNCSRSNLIRWLLDLSEERVSNCEPLIATILCSLLVRQTHNLVQLELRSIKNVNSLSCGSHEDFDEFERVLLQCSFVKPKSSDHATGNSSCEDKGANVPLKLSVVSCVPSRLIECITQDFEKLPNFDYTCSDFLRKCSQLQLRISLYLNIMNVIEKHSIPHSDEMITFRTAIEKFFEKGFFKFTEIFNDYFTKGKPIKSAQIVLDLITIVRKLLISSHLCDSTKTFLSQRFSQHIQELLKKIYRSNMYRHVQSAVNNQNELFFGTTNIFLSRGNITENEIIELAALEAMECILDYTVIFEHRCDIITDLLKDCVQESFLPQNLFVFKLSSLLAQRVTAIMSKYSGTSSEIMPELLSLVQKMCRGYYQIPNCSLKLWNVVAGITAYVSTSNSDVPKKNLMILLGTLTGLMNKGTSYGSSIPVCRAGFRALEVLAKSDRLVTWSVFSTKNSNNWILFDVSEFLNNPSNQIRMFAVDYIATLYTYVDYSNYEIRTTSSTELSFRPPSLEAHFENIYEYILKNFNIPSNLTSDENSEEAVNRTSVALMCLSKLIFANPFIQKHCLYSYVDLLQTKSIDKPLAIRALRFSSNEVSSTLSCHISFLIQTWLSKKYEIKEFPYILLGCESFDVFLETYRKQICVEYFLRNDGAGLQNMCEILKADRTNLIKECYGMIMARFLPGLAFYKSKNQCPPGQDIAQLQEIKKRFHEALGGTAQTDALMMTYLDDVLLETISLVFDAQIPSQWGCPSVCIPCPSSVFYDTETIGVAVQFLNEAASRKNLSLVALLASSKPGSIYGLLVTLVSRIHNAHDILEKFRRLHQFSYFVKLLTNEPQESFCTIKEYVCQFVIYAYIRLLNSEVGCKEYSNHLRRSIVQLMSEVVLHLTFSYKDEVKHHYYAIVKCLVSNSLKYPELTDVVVKLLNCLMINYQEDYRDCISMLEPFPEDVEVFKPFREVYFKVKYGESQVKAEWGLSKELKSCLNEASPGSSTFTLEKLEVIKTLLSSKKRELEKLVKSTEGKRFSEECRNELLHTLILNLVKMIKENTDHNVVLEAARCLGEIGPVDLSVLVLPSLNRSSVEVKSSPNSSLLIIVEILLEYLKSNEIELVIASSNVLQSLCKMSDCIEDITNFLSNTRSEALLKPFRIKTQAMLIKPSPKINHGELETILGLNELDEYVEYPEWIVNLTCGIIECLNSGESTISFLLPVCRIKAEFCREVLPFVFLHILQAGSPNPLIKRTVSSYFRKFLSRFKKQFSNTGDTAGNYTPVSNFSKKSIFCNKLAIRCLLDVIQFLRTQPAPNEHKGSLRSTPWDNNFWIDIPYFDLARAAQYCGAFLSSILFVEIAVTELELNPANSQLDDSALGENPSDSFYSQGYNIARSTRLQGDLYESLLLNAFTSIGEPDAVYGCGYARISNGTVNISHLSQRLEFTRALSGCDGNFVSSLPTNDTGVAASLRDLSLYNTLWTYLQGLETMQHLDDELTEIQYECGWRLSKWELHSDKSTYIKTRFYSDDVKNNENFQRFVYEGIQKGVCSDFVNHLESVKKGYLSVTKSLRHATIESSENLYDFLTRFQLLRLVEDFFAEFDTSANKSINQFLSKWAVHDRIPSCDFKFQEPILFLRGVLIHTLQQSPTFKDTSYFTTIQSAYDDCMLELLTKARDFGRLSLAENTASCLGSDPQIVVRKDFEIAKNYWARGEQDIARSVLGRLLKKSVPDDCALYPSMLLSCGEWLSESMSERPSIILDKYLLKSCQLYEKRDKVTLQEVSKAHFVLAKYADEQYQQVCKYMRSEMFNEKLEYLKLGREDMAVLNSVPGSSTNIEARKSAVLLRKQNTLEENEIRNVIEDKRKFLLIALRHYLKGLKESSDQDLLVFRAVALWLENGGGVEEDPKLSQDVNDIVRNECLPSYKYIVVLHQLSARLNGDSASDSKLMNSILCDILKRCAIEHPHHALPVLLTQALLHKDQEKKEQSRASKKKQGEVEERVKAASSLIEVIRKNKQVSLLIFKMQALWLALIEFANFKEYEANKSSSISISPKLKIHDVKNLEEISIPTVNVPIDLHGYGSNIIGIMSISKRFNLVGGINSPKRISCVGTNGIKYNMLLKGQDDLRQDAVMQQVFIVMNKLLLAESQTRSRRLCIRTYKVVPLSQRTGILEWCENTQTFGNYLIGDPLKPGDPDGAHAKYRPTDFTANHCRLKMHENKDCGDNDRKLATFMAIAEHFKPVFRHFFFENFIEPGVFFERRLAYTRSVATNSMIGYILGLGDRHVLNILIDKTTAELIHIDLGVAFEQGKVLPTPETIPFRLTRDVVDGMGVLGVEGVFRRTCELTMEVLRNNSEIILTILEVLLYDPLYMWTLTADRMKKVQPPNNSKSSSKAPEHSEVQDVYKKRNNAAARVLLRLRQKLAGVEEGGSVSALSVPGHVSLLIQIAMDPARLSRLFPGWQPYL